MSDERMTFEDLAGTVGEFADRALLAKTPIAVFVNGKELCKLSSIDLWNEEKADEATIVLNADTGIFASPLG